MSFQEDMNALRRSIRKEQEIDRLILFQKVMILV